MHLAPADDREGNRRLNDGAWMGKKGPMTGDDDEQYALREALTDEREKTAARLAGLERIFESVIESAVLAPPDDEHDPEGSTVGFERAQIAKLLQNDKAHLADL